jgi:maleamate amidohydrolase
LRTLVPEDCVGDQGAEGHESNLRDVHRRYAEVTSADRVVEYLARIAAEVPA